MSLYTFSHYSFWLHFTVFSVLDYVCFTSFVVWLVDGHILFLVFFFNGPILWDIWSEVLHCQNLTWVLWRARRDRTSILIAVFVARGVLQNGLWLFWCWCLSQVLKQNILLEIFKIRRHMDPSRVFSSGNSWEINLKNTLSRLLSLFSL